MIEVSCTCTDRGMAVSVTGHAGYAESGNDIVCAAVSGMAQMMEYGIAGLLGFSDKIRKAKGELLIDTVDGKEAVVLIKSFYDCCTILEQQYPEHIKTKMLKR